MRKAGFIIALIAIIIDTLVSVIAINQIAQIDGATGVVTLIITAVLLAPMIVALFLVGKNPKWAIAFIVVGAISTLFNISNGTLIPLVPLAELIGGILIITAKD